jgi:hypothetical protein
MCTGASQGNNVTGKKEAWTLELWGERWLRTLSSKVRRRTGINFLERNLAINIFNGILLDPKIFFGEFIL